MYTYSCFVSTESSYSELYLPLTNIICDLILHPYYKLDYFELKWGGCEEQAAERAVGNLDAIDWQQHAKEVVDNMVHQSIHCTRLNVLT